MQVSVDGQLLRDLEAPALAWDDHGFTVGDGVFEALKVIDGVPFALTRHLARMQRSAAGLGLPDPDPGRVRDAVAHVLDAEHLDLGRIRITWTAGRSPLGSPRGSDAVPTLVVAAGPIEPAPRTGALAVVPWPRNERGALAGLKTTSYAENVVALAWARERGADEAVFANLQGNLCEATGSNVAYVVDGEVRTPSLASGCLAGVTRDLLLEWWDVREVDEPASVLERAEEIFVLSTIRDVQGVHRCDGRELEAPGPMTREAMRVWAERSAADLDP